MDSPVSLSSPTRLLASPLSVEPAPSRAIWSVSGWASAAAGLLTAFTFSAVGEVPVGEIVLTAAAGFAIMCAMFNHAAPVRTFHAPFFWKALVAQAIAFVAYVASDLYRHSSTRDIARGWGRMVLLAVDVIAIAYLFGCARRNFVVFIASQAVGLAAYAFTFGPLFGDMWKFGVGAPLTYLLFLIVPLTGPWTTMLGAFGLGWIHFVSDYRSLGGICVVTGVLTVVQRVRPEFRLWLAPLALLAGASLIGLVYFQSPSGTRATRSDVERISMVQAALEAVRESPFIGHGSWFSNSDVYDNFLLIRHAAAKEAHVGGFVGPNHEPEAIALHSQLLVALAEGGIVGGAFFFVFGAALFWGLFEIVLVRRWEQRTPLYTLVLLTALWNLFFSPFSGAQRVYIAMACGLILILQTENSVTADGKSPPA